MGDYNFNSQNSPRGRFGAKQDPGTASVPGANDKNAKLVVRSQDDPATEAQTASLFGKPDASQQDVGPQYGYSKHRFRKKEEVSVFDEEMDRRFGMDVRSKRTVILAIVLAIAFLAAVFLPSGMFDINSHAASFAGFTNLVSVNFSGLLNFLSGANPDDAMGYKLFRYIVIAIAGAALGISGGVYQGALKNALASPTTLGVISGGTLGGAIFVIFFMDDSADSSIYSAQDIFTYFASLTPTEYIMTIYGQAFCTLLGCFVVVGFVVAVATIAGKGKISNAVLIITGQVVAVVVNSIMTLIRTYYSSGYGDLAKASALSSLRSASFSSYYSLLDVVLIGVPVLIGIIVIVAMRMRLNALTFSDEEARSMGISTTATRNIMVGACTMMTAIIVAFCGSISFVGFVVPHLTRKVMGPDFKYYIPATALVGSIFMIAAYFVTSFFSLEDFGGVRLLTSLIGGVAFIAIALAGRKRTTSDGF